MSMNTLIKSLAPIYLPSSNCWELTLACGSKTLIDQGDLWLLELGNWRSERRHGHIRCSVAFHRVAMRAKPGQFIDHKNRDRLDNRKANLRFCTRSENAINRGKPSRSPGRDRPCSSRFKGVTYFANAPGHQHWTAGIKVRGQKIPIGWFYTQESAAMAYDAAAIKHFGSLAVTNAALGLFGDIAVQVTPPDPDAITVRLSGRKRTEMLVDADDEWLAMVATWAPHHQGGYASACIYLHRLITRATPEFDVDHKNGDPRDNRRCNLRLCPANYNTKSRRKSLFCGKPTSSRFKGVGFVKSCASQPSPWRARIMVDGKMIDLGFHKTEESAARAYDEAAIRHHGEFARTNAAIGLLTA